MWNAGRLSLQFRRAAGVLSERGTRCVYLSRYLIQYVAHQEHVGRKGYLVISETDTHASG